MYNINVSKTLHVRRIIFDQYITTLRVISSIGIIASYIYTYYIDSAIGARIAMLCNFGSMPFAIRNKYWDVVFVLSFVIVITGVKVISELKL